jgi:phage terminase large subunit-like protein
MRCFPETVISHDQNKKDYFTTTKAGQYKGAGIGGTVTGFGCNYLVIDDALSPREGASQTIRQSTNEAIRSTLFSRFNDKRTAKLIMIMQRIHDDDPTGNLYKDGGYHLLRLPAETKTHVQIKLKDKEWNMYEGEILTPRLPKESLDELRIDLGEYNYAAQYLQSPVPLGGGEFKHEWYQFYLKPEEKKSYGNVYILADAAGGDELNKKKKKTSDWTAFMVVELAADNNYYLLDCVRDRLNPTERVETLFMLHRKWNKITGKPPKVGYEKYGMMTDTHYTKVRQNEENYRFPLIELGGGMMKEERIRQLIPDMQRGRWYFPESLPYIDGEGRRFDLVKELLDGELPTFPKARFDDMVDALSRIKSPELNAVFPQLKIKKFVASQPESWENW